MDIRELLIIIQEYLLEAWKTIKKIGIESIKGLRILLRIIIKKIEHLEIQETLNESFKGLKILFNFIIKRIPFKEIKKVLGTISIEVYNIIKKFSEMIVEGFLFIMRKILPDITKNYIEPAIQKFIDMVGEGFFILASYTNKATGKALNKVTKTVSEKVSTIKKHPEHQFRYLEDLVKLNMIIVPVYLIICILLFIIWSLTNKLVNLDLQTIYLIIPFLLILCIPFFSFFNLLKNEKFSMVDLILNILFLFLILVSLTIFIVKLIF